MHTDTSTMALETGQTNTTTTTTTVPVLWDQRATADYLGVSHKWLERDRWKGATLPYVKIGRAVRYRAADVLAYVDRNSVVAEVQPRAGRAA